MDDDKAIRTLLTTVLKRKGFWVETARNGEEAIEIIAGMKFAAIVLDLMMPRVDGFEVIDYLERSEPDRLKHCVIVLTAVANRDLVKLDGRRVFRILRKPFDLEELINVVTECVDSSVE